uniref:L-dopachrome isomerase n=1 Tax=Aceria tosichella TaxID=561515 RepID=A0A6G1SE08_9ACAR
MPVFVVNTNVKDVPKDFKQLATEAVAKSLGKPVSYVAVQVNAGQNLSFGGTDEPAALCDLTSIGALSVESNKKHSKALMNLLEKQLGVSSQRVYISFHNLNKADIGFSGTTFDDLM